MIGVLLKNIGDGGNCERDSDCFLHSTCQPSLSGSGTRSCVCNQGYKLNVDNTGCVDIGK